jgi:hypothetical protein
MLAVCLAWGAVLAGGLTPRWLAHWPAGTFVKGPTDLTGFATFDALRVSESPQRLSGVALIGDSSLLHALPPDDELRQLMAERLGAGRGIHYMGAPGLSLLESGALAETVAGNLDGLIVITISPNMLARASRDMRRMAASPRLGLESDLVRRELRARRLSPGPHTGLYLVDHHKFLAERLLPGLFHLLSGPVAGPKRIPPKDEVRAAQNAHLELERLVEVEDAEGARGRDGVPQLRRILSSVHAAGDARILLLEHTHRPEGRSAPLRPNRESCAPLLSELLERGEALYADLDEAAALQPRDFLDPVHIRSLDARRRYAEALAALLAENLAEIDRAAARP